MLKAQFCFIKQDYFDKYDKEKLIPQNHEPLPGGELHNRPCFFIFDDSKERAIAWCIPISSKTEKYNNMREQKLLKMRERGETNPVCKEIAFGKVLGKGKAFLIRNAFPVTMKYIDNFYMDKNGNPVTIAKPTENFIIHCTKELLAKEERHPGSVFFANVLKIKKELLEELEADKEKMGIKPGRTNGNTFVATGFHQGKEKATRSTMADYKRRIADIRSEEGHTASQHTHSRENGLEK